MDKQVSYVAILHTTAGDIVIKLNDNQTPKTVENFVTLAKKAFIQMMKPLMRSRMMT